MRVVDPNTIVQMGVQAGAQTSVGTARTVGPRVDGPDKRGQQTRRSDGFRAALDAATGDAPRQTAQTVTTGAARSAPETIVTRTSDSSQELSAADTAELYRVVQAAARNAKAEPAEFEEPAAPAVPPQIASRVASQYARRYFSVGGTFAARGDALELTT